MSSTAHLKKKQLIKVMASDLSVLRFIATELEWKKVNLMEANKITFIRIDFTMKKIFPV